MSTGKECGKESGDDFKEYQVLIKSGKDGLGNCIVSISKILETEYSVKTQIKRTN